MQVLFVCVCARVCGCVVVLNRCCRQLQCCAYFWILHYFRILNEFVMYLGSYFVLIVTGNEFQTLDQLL